MPAIKNIATAKKKGTHTLEHIREARKRAKRKPEPSMPWRNKDFSVKAKNGRVKKVTKLTAAFVSAASGKKVKISAQAKSGRKSKVNLSSARATNMIFGEKQSYG